MEFSENNKWVIIEMNDAAGEIEFFFAPLTLDLPFGFVGNIIWFVFTPGWELAEVSFAAGSGFDGAPQPDPSRPGCWSTAAANLTGNGGPFHYTVAVLHLTGGRTYTHRDDPVVENDPPPPPGTERSQRPAAPR